MDFLDTPLKELECPRCRVIVAPQNQIRLDADECGQPTAIIGFDCPKCRTFQSVTDDAEILLQEIIG